MLGASRPIAVGASASPTGSYNQRDSDVVPPLRFQRDYLAMVATVSTQDGLEAECGKPADHTKIRSACTLHYQGKTVIVLPNPCLPQFAGQDFAARLCHEMGHAEGWSANHEP